MAAPSGTPKELAPEQRKLRPGTNRGILSIVDIHADDFETHKHEVARELMKAAEIGFFYIKGHAIPQEVIDGAFEANRFICMELPEDVKNKTADEEGQMKEFPWMSKAYTLGYSNRGNKVAKLRQAFFAGFDIPWMQGHWFSEDTAPGHKKAVLDLMWHNARATDIVMRGFAIGLGYDEFFFKDAMDPNHSDNRTAMNMNWYEACTHDFPADTLRIGAHVDFEVLTLLHTRTGEPGLEVCPGRDATAEHVMDTEWTSMDPVPGAITVNMGEALEYWSDGRLKACFHRVRYPRPEEYKGVRQSLAYFANSRESTNLQGPEKRYPPVTFPQIMSRIKAKIAAKNINMEELSPEEYAKKQREMVSGPIQPGQKFDDPWVLTESAKVLQAVSAEVQQKEPDLPDPLVPVADVPKEVMQAA